MQKAGFFSMHRRHSSIEHRNHRDLLHGRGIDRNGRNFLASKVFFFFLIVLNVFFFS